MQSEILPFNDSVMALMAASECRLVESVSEKEDVFRLRYDSYLKEQAITPNVRKSISDRFDDSRNSLIFGIYIQDELAGSVRLSLSRPGQRDIPAAFVFGDILDGFLGEDTVILDPTRFVVREKHARVYAKLPYVTLRVAWLATEYFKVDYTLASVRFEHQAFYRRFYGHKVVCAPRPYPSLIKPLSLMALDFLPNQARGLARYPFLKSQLSEKQHLFASMDAKTPA